MTQLVYVGLQVMLMSCLQLAGLLLTSIHTHIRKLQSQPANIRDAMSEKKYIKRGKGREVSRSVCKWKMNGKANKNCCIGVTCPTLKKAPTLSIFFFCLITCKLEYKFTHLKLGNLP